MTFDTNRLLPVQEQFIIIEIDALEIDGVCDLPAGGEGFYTPLTCIQQVPLVTRTHYFGTPNTPLQFGNEATAGDGSIIITDPIYRVVNNVSENVTELKPSEGLAGRGTLAILFGDFPGDPSLINPTIDGTYFGKFEVRNILANNEVRIKYFHVKPTGQGYLPADALEKSYIIETFAGSGKNRYRLNARDELTKTDEDQTQFPIPTNGSIRVAIDDSTVTIPVDAVTLYEVDQVIYIGGEFMKVNAVADIQTSTASLTVDTRGGNIIGDVSGEILTRTRVDSHDVDDAIQICYISDDERIDDLLKTMTTSSGIDISKIPESDWEDEVDEWHPNVLINTLWFDPKDSNKQIKKVLVTFLMDMWYDNVDKELKLSAISVWKESSITLVEGEHIDFDSINTFPKEELRFSRAFIFRNKPFLADDDTNKSYKALTVHKDLTLETPGFFGESKTKEFDANSLIDKTSAQLLTQRFVSRFGFTPVLYAWKTQERFLNFKTGDIVDLISEKVQNFDGTPKPVRAQVLKIKPRIGKLSRVYDVKALTYEAAFTSGTEFNVTGINCNINLHTLAGAPSQIVVVIFIFDNATLCSLDTSIPSVVAGNFTAGSKIIIVAKNGTDWQSKGGEGGTGGTAFHSREAPESGDAFDGLTGDDGGVCYDAQGIDTDIYLSGTFEAHTALGDLRAPGGGGAGSFGEFSLSPNEFAHGGQGGGGGAGDDVGPGGTAGPGVYVETGGNGDDIDGNPGDPGDKIGNGGAGATGLTATDGGDGGDWGLPGETSPKIISGDVAGGLAGSGVILNGATVCIFGATVGTNFINGNGDTACFPDTGPIISNISSGTPTDVTITVTWDTDVPATSQINYGLTSGYGSSTTKDTNLVTSHSQTITGLDADTLYNFQCVSENATEVETLSANQTATTASDPDTDPPVISNISSGTPNETSAVITWDTDEGADSQVEYGLTGSYGSFTTLNTNLTTNHSEAVTGLDSGTLYNYRVLSVDASSNAAASANNTFTTSSGGGIVSYPGGSVSDFRIAPTDARAAFLFQRNGEVFKKKATDAATFWHDWADPKNSSVGDDYEIRATMIFGDDLSGSALDTWLPLTTSREWYTEVTSNFGESTGSALIEVRDVATETIQESQVYECGSFVEP